MATSAQQKIALRAFGVAGAFVFATFFALTFAAPQWLETFAAEFIEARTLERVDASIDSLGAPEGDGALSRVAGKLYASNALEIERHKADLKAGTHAKMAAAFTQIRDPACECRKNLQTVLEDGAELRLTSLATVNARLVDFIHGSYMRVLGELRRDVRIFTASNAVAFLLLVLVSFLKPQAVRHLFLPGVLLAAATTVCAYLYLFEQNWLLTIIYGDYLGFAYSAYLAAAFVFLCDIAFNRARITTAIVNSVAEALGLAFSLALC